ncbi:hypothetical protein TSOC_007793 [Tetrabaena socialis]|uniref:Uncharacterized protein n=1 Tax=Tetrabaena socialis TaxID=47790 RepID=A0A2J8A054_9CHLO|nr:hypothetical protein TSOC_007793 [Tetrabaena socialis]|eukprot:PNH05911.1 hypothetical protein TSOC_007793 [Tetrabaena socialis]
MPPPPPPLGPRIWLAGLWFVIAILVVTYHYPAVTGTFHSAVKSSMMSYEPAPGANIADVRSTTTFSGGLSHALGFLTAYVNKAVADGQPEGTVPVTEYDRIFFARLAVDYATNCRSEYVKNKGFRCYLAGTNATTGQPLGPDQIAALAGQDGFRQLLADELAFISTYAFSAELQLGVVNRLAAYRTSYLFTVKRKSGNSIGSQTKVVHTLAHYDAVKGFADLRLQHLVWGIFSTALVGLRVVPACKTQTGLRMYSTTLKLTWDRIKDLIVFFGYLVFLVTVLVSPLFELTGASTLFKDTGTTIQNVFLMTFGYIGFYDYFSDEAPTFGSYRVIVFIMVIISQNVLLALVASAYEEAREEEGAVERSHFALSLYRLWWMLYSRWHRWVLRKSSYALFEDLLAATRVPDAWVHQHVFVRWALSDLPETRLLAMFYTDPASEVLYLYSPWAWTRGSAWDTAQQAPWDAQLDYPMYAWQDVPLSGPGERPRLRCLPPLFSRGPAGGPTSLTHMPMNYREGDARFAMSETEVDELLEVVGCCWARMQRYSLVTRFAGVGWSERGQALLREGLLEVYRRHRVEEFTTSAVRAYGTSASAADAQQAAKAAQVKAAALLDDPQVAGVDAEEGVAAVDLTAQEASGGGNGGGGEGRGAASERTKQFSMFNRRGRIADNLDLLWGEVSEMKGMMQRQQDEVSDIKRMMQMLLDKRSAGDGSSGGPATDLSLARREARPAREHEDDPSMDVIERM